MIKDIEINDEMLLRANRDIAKRSGTGSYIYIILWLVIMFLNKFHKTAPLPCLVFTLAFILLAVARVIIVFNFNNIYQISPFLWKALFYPSVWFAALLWGILCAAVLAVPAYKPLTLPVLISTAGLVGGGATSFSPNRLLTGVIIAVYLLPSSIVLALTNTQHTSVSVIFVIYAFSMYLITHTHYEQYWLVNKYSFVIEKQAAKLKEQNTLDGLTGLKNRAYFDRYLRKEIKAARRVKSDLSLLFIDIDHFKNINDQYGHLIGDECLRRLSALLKQHIKRETDITARYGGEEFAVILPFTEIEDAKKMAEDIRKKVMKIDSKYGEAELTFTVSIGVTGCRPQPDNNSDTFIEFADKALYEAKNSGRNQVKFLPVAGNGGSNI